MHHPIWGCLSAPEVVHLLADESSTEQLYVPEQVILRAGDSGDSLFLIEAGSAEVVHPGKEGQSLSLAVWGTGDFFGEIAVMGSQRRSTTRGMEMLGGAASKAANLVGCKSPRRQLPDSGG